jgi:hypothetical protein
MAAHDRQMSVHGSEPGADADQHTEDGPVASVRTLTGPAGWQGNRRRTWRSICR